MISFKNVRVQLSDEDYSSDLEAQVVNARQAETYKALYGSDLAMLGVGDLLSEKKISGSGLRVASGVLNYAQAIYHRLSTVRGTLPEDPTVGIPWYDFLGKTYQNKEMVIFRLSELIHDEVYRDNRTEQVKSINVEFKTPNIITVSLVTIPISGNPTTIEFDAQQI